MKSFRIFLAFFVTFGLFSVTPAWAAEKTMDMYYWEDLDYEHWAYNELERFLYADIIDGSLVTEEYEEDGEIYEYTSVHVNPNNSITRAEFTKILVNALDLSKNNIGKSFLDVNSSDWYYEYVQIASSHDIIKGTPDGTFLPNEKVTREQMAAMIYRSFQPTVDFSATGNGFPDVSAESYAYEAVVRTAAAGIIKGSEGFFHPYNDATRAEAIVMIDRALHQESGTDEDKLAATQIVDRNIKDEMKYTNQQDVEALKTLYRETTMGYYLSYSLDGLDMVGEGTENDGTFTMEQVDEHSLKVESINKRFAQVRIDNLHYKISMTAPDMSFNMTINLSGTAYLNKTEDGTWKIYNILIDEENDQDWEEAAAAAIN